MKEIVIFENQEEISDSVLLEAEIMEILCSTILPKKTWNAIFLGMALKTALGQNGNRTEH